MRVEYSLRRLDLVLLNFYILPRHRANWLVLLAVAVGFTVWQLSKREAVSVALAIGMGVGGLFVGTCAILGSFIFSLTVSLVRASNNNGQLGKRVLTLTAEGVSNETSFSSGLIKWQAIRSVRATRRYIYIEFTPSCFFVVPKSELGSEADAFYQYAAELVNASRV